MNSLVHSGLTASIPSAQNDEPATYAPDPWRIELVENYQGVAHLIGARIVTDSVLVADVAGAVLSTDGDRFPENAANAVLLSTAPELYEAAVELELCRAANEAFDDIIDPLPEYRAALDLRIANAFDGLRAAITKASTVLG